MTKLEEEYKQFVRQKLGVKRVTKRMWHNAWSMASNKNKEKFAKLKFPTQQKSKAPVPRQPTPTNGPPTVVLKKTNVCVLGQGAFGRACVRETPGGKKYVVKTALHVNGILDLLREKKIHMDFYYKLPQPLRRYFPKPVNVKDEPSTYAMTMFDGITLYNALTNSHRNAEYKRKVVKELRKAIFALWSSRYIHGDIHTQNIMVSKDVDNPKIQILDFGMMRKSRLTPPSTNFKLNNVGYNNLTNDWLDWFKKSWKAQLKDLELSSANPNLIVFPKKLGTTKYYAKAHSMGLFKNLNRHGNSLTPKAPIADDRLKRYKQMVRNRMGVKRVTKQAQFALWKKLTTQNKKQFGTWKPEGVVEHRVTPKPKAPTPPSMDQQIARDYAKAGGRIMSSENLLRFWMTHYTTAQKKALYKKVRSPEKAKKDYPLCK